MRNLSQHLRAAAVIVAVIACAVGASAATYPYPTSAVTGTTITVGTCAGWGLDPDPIGASSCATTTITRTASASDLTLTNSATVQPGFTYATSMTITRTAGTVTLSVGGDTGTARSSSATFTENFTTTTNGPITLTFDAAFAGTITTTITVQPIQGWATYTPNTSTTPASEPDAGAVMPADAAEVLMSVESYPVRILYNVTPTATLGVKIPAGTVLKWGPEDIAKFRAIRFIDTAEGASTVNLAYSRGQE